MTTVDARLARLEEQIRDAREDVSSLLAEVNRSRTRLHNLEGFAQSYLDVQREHRRMEERQYRRITRAIALAGVCMSAAMVILALATLLTHH